MQTFMRARLNSWSLTLVALGVTGVVFPIALAGPVLFGGVQGPTDPVGESVLIAQQATDVTKYLLTLATGIVGLVGFLMSEKLTTYWGGLTRSQRQWVVVGVVLSLVSVWTGLVAMWMVLDLTMMKLVRDQLDRIMWLHIVEVLELSFGVLLVALAVLPEVLKHERPGHVQR
jgi:hypothetical protein